MLRQRGWLMGGWLAGCHTPVYCIRTFSTIW